MFLHEFFPLQPTITLNIWSIQTIAVIEEYYVIEMVNFLANDEFSDCLLTQKQK